mgnify:CR=1 FL=1
MVEFIIQSLVVFALSVLELWLAIPVGLVMGLNPVAILVMSILGAICGALIVARVGEKLRSWLSEKYGWDILKKRQGIIHKIWQKYGVIGLGLLSPFLTGAPLGTALGIALGIPRKKLLLWISIGIILWGIGLTIAGAMGKPFIEDLIG